MTDPTRDPDLVSKYFAEHIRRGFRNIFEEQRRIAATKIYGKQAYRTDGTPRSRSGRLQQALENPVLLLDGSGSTLSAKAVYPLYIRFLDMKRLGNYRIYNRPVWGILYKQTIADIRYEFRSWVTNLLKKTISDSYKP